MVHIEDVKKLYNDLLKDYYFEKDKLQKINELEQNILHYIECENYNAAQGSQLIKKLREERRSRRKIKVRLQELQCLVDRLDNAHLDDIELKEPNYYHIPIETILSAEI